ncbi:Rv0361 family membrane protein [Glycomyces salinus]|uniref:Rv0361 family membrane protein n=1 Tax=Glycomyces salinus TaxID=980294 RepID=UPI0018EA7657|nr:hypothetical protein [Glycomyces salinus]
MSPDTAAPKRQPDTDPTPEPETKSRPRPGRFWTYLTLIAAAAFAGALFLIAAKLFAGVEEIDDSPERTVEGFLAALLDERDPEAASGWLCSEKSDRDLTAATEALAEAGAEHGLEWTAVTETDRTVGQATVTVELSTEAESTTWTFALVAEDGDPQWLVCDIDSR